ncbi:hypothetical protein [Asticcacaulis endophyticus]|uniref:Uncharacterized protein n=1 Tax=Asticcacaulis endophyticus TaxID=1395890 RepID=A0A918UQK7_9CAUL|nr:hypothetical protein [Asticcacaulis endophyticus]GGZ27130.1 hypothetical protein GCM10011273_10960 [Asticcacaulis endophyticus]
MDFEDLMELSRDSYVSQFASFIEKQQALHDKGSAEVKFQLSDHSGLYRQFYCADYASNDDGVQIVEMTPDEEVSFDSISVSLGELEMTVQRLNWHDVTLTLEGEALPPEAFAEWFETWFDPDETNTDWDSKFSSHVHSLLLDGHDIHVDFGTAPVEALVELFVLIEGAGVKAATVS